MKSKIRRLGKMIVRPVCSFGKGFFADNGGSRYDAFPPIEVSNLTKLMSMFGSLIRFQPTGSQHEAPVGHDPLESSRTSGDKCDRPRDGLPNGGVANHCDLF